MSIREVAPRPRIFADTSKVDEIENLDRLGLVDGITTNPSIVADQVGQENPSAYYKNLVTRFPDKPVSIQLLGRDPVTKERYDVPTLIRHAKVFAEISPMVVIKVPMWGDGRGLEVLKILTREGIATNVTGLMKKEQVQVALFAARGKAGNGPAYVSLFENRILDGFNKPQEAGVRVFNPDIHGSGNPLEEIARSRELIEALGFSSQIITGSIRKGSDVVEAYVAGSHIVTVQPKVIFEMIGHFKTEEFDLKCSIDFERATSSK